VPTPQFADWLEGARDASDRAAREADGPRRVVLARRAANGWERAANVLLERRGRDWWPDAATLLRRAAADWEIAGNPGYAAEARARAARLDAMVGPGRLIHAADPRPWTDPEASVTGPPHR
jgi:hypothetical protein